MRLAGTSLTINPLIEFCRCCQKPIALGHENFSTYRLPDEGRFEVWSTVRAAYCRYCYEHNAPKMVYGRDNTCTGK